MKKRLTRRKFLATGLKGSVVVGSAGWAAIQPLGAARALGPPATFEPDLRDTLRVAMDEIIPTGDGMPSATEVGGLEYLARVAGGDAEIKAQLEKSLKALARLSQTHFGKKFASLPKADRTAALEQFEKQKPLELFATLRDLVYESYYTNLRVWKMVGYEFYAANAAGPKMKAFDDSLLANVRKKGKLYREVG